MALLFDGCLQLSIELKFNVFRSLKTEIISILFQGPCSNELQETHCFVSEEDQEQGAKKVILNLSYIHRSKEASKSKSRNPGPDKNIFPLPF